MEEVPNLINICPKHSNFKPTWIFSKNIFYVPFKWYSWQKWKILMLVLGLNSKDRKSTWDKANISNPKINRDCPPLKPTIPQQTVRKFHLDPQYNIFHWGSSILGVSKLCVIIIIHIFILAYCICEGILWLVHLCKAIILCIILFSRINAISFLIII